MNLISISSIDDECLNAYRNIRNKKSKAGESRFIVEGLWLVERLQKSRFHTESILVCQRHVDRVEQLDLQCPVYVVPDQLVDQLLGFSFHRGVLACGVRDKALDWSTFESRLPSQATLVVCPQIGDAVNLGGVVRNCQAFGVDGLILGDRSADAFSRRAIRVSMGTVFDLPVMRTDNLPAMFERLSCQLGFDLVATVLDPSAESLRDVRRTDRQALLFGEEGFGLQDACLQHCDRRVTLPMKSGTDSLNLASAVGVFLYHFTG